MRLPFNRYLAFRADEYQDKDSHRSTVISCSLKSDTITSGCLLTYDRRALTPVFALDAAATQQGPVNGRWWRGQRLGARLLQLLNEVYVPWSSKKANSYGL